MPTNPGMMSSESQEWETPQDFFDRLDEEFHFTLDVAATSENAKCKQYYTLRDNALWQRWTGVVFCNPPFGRLIGKFVRKGFEEAQGGAVVVMLIGSRTDTAYWHNFVMKAKEIRFVRGRVLHTRPDGTGARPPFPSAVVVFEKGVHQPIISSMEA